MSNRTLLEINHDMWSKIKERPMIFTATLLRYLSSANKENAEALCPFGIRVFGMRHHSDYFIIDWGGTKVSE